MLTRYPPLEEGRFGRLRTDPERSDFLLRYTAFSPSSHGTRPWILDAQGRRIELRPDPALWLPAADPDRRELHESLGCALETLVVAADHFGCQADLTHVPGSPVTRLEILPGGGHGLDPDLFRALPFRKTCRSPFDGRPVPAEQVDALRTCVDFTDVRIDLTDDPALLRRARRLTVQADLGLFADPAWRAETARWFGQGALSTAWPAPALGKVMISRFNLAKSTARGDARLLGTSPLFGMVSVHGEGPEVEVRAGRTLMRLWLKATSLGLAFQPVSQMLQRPETRSRAVGLLAPAPWRPLQPFRVGHAARPISQAPKPFPLS
jgi:hypothetical protein